MMGRFLAVLLGCSALCGTAMADEYSRYYFFGDSLSDNGNFKNTFGGPAGPGTAPPLIGFEDPSAYPSPLEPATYGVGGISNGPVWSAQFDPSQKLVTEVAPNTTDSFNFAWAGAAANIYSVLAPVPDVTTQAFQFANLGYVDEETIGGAAGFVWSGGNDVLNQIERESFAALNEFIPEELTAPLFFVPVLGDRDDFLPGSTERINAGLQLAAQATRQAVETLVDAGVKVIVVPNLPDISKTPGRLVLGPVQRQAYFDATQFYNAALQVEIAELREGLPDDVRVIEIDMYTAFNALLARADELGFTNTTEQCLEDDACRNNEPGVPETYVFWDTTHPTEIAHGLVAGLMADVLNIGGVRGAGGLRAASLSQSFRSALTGALRARMGYVSRTFRSPDADPAPAAAFGMNQSPERFADTLLSVDQAGEQPLGQELAPRSQLQEPHVFIMVQAGWSDLGEVGYLSDGGTAGQTGSADTNTYTVTAGWDGMLSSHIFGGVAGFYGWGQSETSGFDSDLMTGGAALYGSYLSGNFHADLSLTYALQALESTRMTGIGLAAEGDTDGREFGADFQIGYDATAGSWTVSPVAGVSFARHTIDGYTEQDAPSLNLTYSDQTIETLLGRVEVSGARGFSTDWADGGLVHLALGFEADLIGTGHRLTVENRSATGAGVTTLNFEDRDRRAITGRVGLRLPLSERLQGDLYYDGAFAVSDIEDTSHVLSARLSWRLN